MSEIKSNEVEALQECVRMIGGSDDYKMAVIFAAFAKTFSNSVTVVKTESIDGFTFFLDIFLKNGKRDMAIQCRLPLRFRELFDD